MAVTVVVLAAAVAVAAGQFGRSPAVGGVPPDRPSGDAGLAGVSLSPVATAASPSAATACEVTKPTAPFVPPEGYPTEPPPAYGSEWYGTPALWIMLGRDGETWADLPRRARRPVTEDLLVEHGLGPGGGSGAGHHCRGNAARCLRAFTAGQGTNASADFGTAMLVRVTVPSPGCWRLTGTYLDASLSIVVLVKGD